MRPLLFVTGASSGIGQALAWHYYQQGFDLALVARRVESVAEWVDRQSLDRSRVAIYGADVSRIDDIVAATQRCMHDQGVPDVVIANAGLSVGMDSRVRADLDVMATALATNTLGVAATFHAFIAPMVARGSGTLVGIGSVAGVRGLPGHGAYCASKAAVITYCESLRGELRTTGVQVVTVCPGYVDTPLTQRNRYAMPFLLAPEAFARKAAMAITQGRSYCVIPWQMGWVARLLRLLPNSLFDRAFSGRPRKHRQGE